MPQARNAICRQACHSRGHGGWTSSHKSQSNPPAAFRRTVPGFAFIKRVTTPPAHLPVRRHLADRASFQAFQASGPGCAGVFLSAPSFGGLMA
ncbi:hypothetical protein GCM10019059_29640 [Camelimonas fluminis]|nr:hypothetical protein GCM10019059_29640 [Camelimonas fluminis]